MQLLSIAIQQKRTNRLIGAVVDAIWRILLYKTR